jgi:putative colanic acid biosynthesis acetyltransferase WcaF
MVWQVFWIILYRPSPSVFHGWRRLLLRAFGAKIGKGAHPYPRAKIWAPWNLEMGAYSCIADDVDCYSIAKVSIGKYAVVSQYSYLCTGSHDARDAFLPLVSAPIVIEDEAWVAADVFIGPGVCIGYGAVVGARSSIFRDVMEWEIVSGSPAIGRGLRPAFSRSY